MDFRPLRPDDGYALARFFETIRRDERFFHPHPLTREAAEELCNLETLDEYVVAEANGEIIAYGMLRGWDEGYAIPSLGIAVHPGRRGGGVARRLMLHLHQIAATREAPSVRLKVYVANAPAVALYRSLGYELEPLSDDELLGVFALDGGSLEERLARGRPVDVSA